MATSLVKKNVQQQLNIFNDGLTKAERLPPGHMRLYNFYRPALQAEVYNITAFQTVTAGSQSIEIFNTDGKTTAPLPQQFSVDAPQFNLDPKIINSYYPPDGHQDQGNILPHIVFTDPHAPWYRPAGQSPWMNENLDTDTTITNPPTDRGNLVPWMALMVFKADDLHVPLTDAQNLGLDKIKSGQVASTNTDGTNQMVTVAVYNEKNQPASGAFKMTVGDYLTKIKSTVNYHAAYPDLSPGPPPDPSPDWTLLTTSTDTTSIIFPPQSMVRDVFGPSADSKDSQALQGLLAQKLHSHVRQLNTVGFPDAGVQGNGYYSVVMSMMTGDMTITAPTNHVVHLVSIENLDKTIPNFAANTTDRIGLVSLYSWTYQCIPEAVNFEILMANLGTHIQPLRAPSEQLSALQGQIDALTANVKKGSASATDRTTLQAASKLYQRLQAGFTVARWRAPSGEESMAFNRSPLVPILTPEVPTSDVKNVTTAWPPLSMHGRDYGVLDKSMGVFDATYAAAWSLGRLVAVSDSVFNAALMRFRSAIWNASTSALRKEANGVKDWAQALTDSVDAISLGSNLSSGKFAGDPTRVNKSANVPVAPPVDHHDMIGRLVDHIDNNVKSTATSTYKDADGNTKQSLYNGFDTNPAASSDWEVIYNWIYECLFLGHIPAHVLFPEPSYLKTKTAPPYVPGQTTFQQEALRFFYIDHAWLDCFIDGALSCANHVEPQYDNIRLKIKQIFNQVLGNKVGGLTKPPVPRYGFIIRSAAVKATPDLKLTVNGWTRVGLKKMNDNTFRKFTKDDTGKPDKFEWVADPNFNPLVRHTKLDDYTILSLVSCLPEEIAFVEMAQPAHQQRFALGVSVNVDNTTNLATIKSEIDTIKLFTNADRAPPNSESGAKPDPALLEPPDMEWPALPPIITDDANNTYYNPQTRCIDSIRIANKFCSKLVDWGKTSLCFDESDATHPTKGIADSSMLGLELNDRAYHFRIDGKQPDAAMESFPDWTRKLWTGPDTGTPAPRSPLPSDSPFTAISPSSSTTPVPPGIPPPTPLNKLRAIPMTQSPVTPSSTKITNWGPSGNPQFELLMHPDYRPVAPRPAGPTLWFSPQDYLATETTFLFDLVFAIRRRTQIESSLKLRALRIEIPVSLGSLAQDSTIVKTGQPPAPNPARLKPREPLLKAGEFAHAGAAMLYNQRFVPSLYNGPASHIGDLRWDDQPVLGITLIPRSGDPKGAMPITDDGAVAMAVALAEVQLNPVVAEEPTRAYSVPPASKGGTWSTALVAGATQVRVRLVEQYDGRLDRSSFCTVPKVRGPDRNFPDR